MCAYDDALGVPRCSPSRPQWTAPARPPARRAAPVPIHPPVWEGPEPTGSRVTEWLAGRGWLEAGPPGGGAHEVGKVLAEYNALREVALWADGTLRSRKVG